MKQITDPIIERIEEIIKDIPGWSPVDQLYTLFNLVYTNSHIEGDIIELGSWCGRSASVLGFSASLIGNTNVICIDLFPEKSDWKKNQDGSFSFNVKVGDKTYGGYHEQTVWTEPFEKDVAPLYENHNSVFDVFLETMTKKNLLNVVTPFKGDSTILKEVVSPEFKCKLAFIDGDHGYKAVKQDIRNIEPYLVEGGWICFDDAFSSYEGVDSAITELIINNPDYELGRQMTRKLFVARKKKQNKL